MTNPITSVGASTSAATNYTSVPLNDSTIDLIKLALQSPGTNNINYINAYNAIYGEIEGSGINSDINSGTQYWFS